MFVDNPAIINNYAHKLESLGPLLYAAEIILLFAFLFHMYLAVTETLKNWGARSSKYVMKRNAGGVSKKTISSSTMIYTGLVVGIFTVIHLITFKYGPGMAEGYVQNIHGENVRDLHRLVMEVFQNPYYVLGYVAVMVFLGFHLRHGFWSAFQSLGANNPKYSPLIYTVAAICAVVIAVGFLALPIWIYFIY